MKKMYWGGAAAPRKYPPKRGLRYNCESRMLIDSIGGEPDGEWKSNVLN